MAESRRFALGSAPSFPQRIPTAQAAELEVHSETHIGLPDWPFMERQLCPNSSVYKLWSVTLHSVGQTSWKGRVEFEILDTDA